MLDSRKFLVSNRDITLRDDISVALKDFIIKLFGFLGVKCSLDHSITVKIINQVHFKELAFSMCLNWMLLVYCTFNSPVNSTICVQILH